MATGRRSVGVCGWIVQKVAVSSTHVKHGDPKRVPPASYEPNTHSVATHKVARTRTGDEAYHPALPCVFVTVGCWMHLE